IGILLHWICDLRAVVHWARPRGSRAAVAVPVGIRAGIAGIALAVPILILLGGIRDVRTVVASVAASVPVPVLLARVRDGGAVVEIAADPVGVLVVERIERARVARIPNVIAVAVGLVRIRHLRTVVRRAGRVCTPRVPEPVVVGILARVAGIADAVVIRI